MVSDSEGKDRYFDAGAFNREMNALVLKQLKDAGAHEDHHDARLELTTHYSMFTAKIVAVTCVCFNLDIEKFITMQTNMTRCMYLETMAELKKMENKHEV